VIKQGINNIIKLLCRSRTEKVGLSSSFIEVIRRTIDNLYLPG